MSFYGQKTNLGNFSESKHLLELIRCYNFFGKDDAIRIFQLSIYDINVLEEDFELLLDIIDVIGYDDNTIKLINKNLPEKYDLTKFPEELLCKMLKLEKKYYIVSESNINDDTTISVWDALTSKEVNTLTDYRPGTIGVGCLSNNILVASLETDCNIKIQNALTGEIITSIDNTCDVAQLCFSSDGKYLAYENETDDIYVWDVEMIRQVNILYSHNHNISKICFSRDNKYIAVGTCDNIIKIFSIDEGFDIATLDDRTDYPCNIVDICYSPDNKYIASVNDDKDLKIWNINDRLLVKVFSIYESSKTSICYSTDGKFIISGHYDKSIKIWDIETGNIINTLESHTDIIKCVCYSPDGKYIISGSSDGTVKIWHAKKGKLINTLKFRSPSVNDIYCLTVMSNLEIKLTNFLNKN
jgi:WD40 repeat protein